MASSSEGQSALVGPGSGRGGGVWPGWLLAAPWAMGFVLVNPAAGPVQEGNEAYQAGDYERALACYRAVQDAGEDEPVLHFNAGAALYRQERYKEAVEEYQRALGSGTDLDAATHYNIGNCEFRMGRLEQAIASYRRSLELNPSDRAAKHNLELAMQMLKQAQSQPPQQKQGKQDEKQGDSDEAKGQQDQRPGREEQTKQPDEQPTPGAQREGEDGAEQAAAKPARMVPMSREDALKLLEALATQDREVQKRIVRVPIKPFKLPTPDKDW